MIAAIEASHDGFEVRLANGETASADRIVVATGLEHAAYIPPVLAHLPSQLLSHSADHHDLSRFREKDVTVIGAGQSALETAALLFDAGASVRLLVRRPTVMWSDAPAN